MFPLSRPMLLLCGMIVVLCLGIVVYLWNKPSTLEEEDTPGLPSDYLAQVHAPDLALFPPTHASHVPLLKPPRNWKPTLESYLNLIFFALSENATCCLPIDPAFLPGILDWYAGAQEDIQLSLEVIQRGKTGKMARILVSPEAPTGKHRAVHL